MWESGLDNIPKLEGYHSNRIVAFRDGKRSNLLMGTITAQLSGEGIEDLAGFFCHLPQASKSVTGELTETMDPNKVSSSGKLSNRK